MASSMNTLEISNLGSGSLRICNARWLFLAFFAPGAVYLVDLEGGSCTGSDERIAARRQRAEACGTHICSSYPGLEATSKPTQCCFGHAYRRIMSLESMPLSRFSENDISVLFFGQGEAQAGQGWVFGRCAKNIHLMCTIPNRQSSLAWKLSHSRWDVHVSIESLVLLFRFCARRRPKAKRPKRTMQQSRFHWARSSMRSEAYCVISFFTRAHGCTFALKT